MKLRGKEGSRNIDDRRGNRGRGMSGRTKTAGGFGIGTLIIVIIIMLMGGDPSELLEASGGAAAPGRCGDGRRGGEKYLSANYVW